MKHKIEKEWLYQEYSINGRSTKEIANSIGVCKSVILYYIGKYKLKYIPKYRNKDWLYNEYITNEKSTGQIAEDCGVTDIAIRKTLNDFNIQIRTCGQGHLINKTSIQFDNKETFCNLYENQKLSSLQISSKIGMSVTVVCKRLKKYGIVLRSPSEIRIGVRSNKNKNGYDGSNRNFYKSIREAIKYIEWRDFCFKRDDYTCQFCGIRGGDLEVDHIKQFIDIIKENNITKQTTLDEIYECKELWNTNNGRTLCKKCHRKTETFGKSNKNNK